MRVGVLDILALPSQSPADAVYHALITKQFASITPQAISVWCRRLGHDTFYAVYYGAGDARRLLPPDLDLVVKDCDQALIADILAGQFDPGSVVSSARPFDDVPTVEERMPEIRASAFYWGRK